MNNIDTNTNTAMPISVPTSSAIAHAPGNPFKVCVIRQTVKHRGRLTLAGGRVELHRQNHSECMRDEWDQEAGGEGSTLVDMRLWAVKTDPYADVRQVTLGKVTHNLGPLESRDLPVTAHYGSPDCLFLAQVDGIPAPKDGEATECIFIDVREIRVTETADESTFGAQHDLILALYCKWLEDSSIDLTALLADFELLRAYLLSRQ